MSINEIAFAVGLAILVGFGAYTFATRKKNENSQDNDL